MLTKARLLAAAILMLGVATAAAADVRVQVELNQQFFYEEDPLVVRVTVRNEGDTEVANPVKMPLFDGFVVGAPAGDDLTGEKKPDVDPPDRPARLAPGAFYGGVVDVSKIYPQLRQRGTYRLHWFGDGLLSQQFEITVIPRFDRNRVYQAHLDTTMGPIVLNLFQDRSPIAAKALIDLANSGFYDGLEFHEVRGDEYIVGGSPAAVGRRVQPFRYPFQATSMPIVAGTVLIKPAGAAPPANGPEFIISLKPQAAWQGQLTVVGQVARGLDVVQKISRLANSGPAASPPNRPKTPVTIRSVKIVEGPEPGKSGG